MTPPFPTLRSSDLLGPARFATGLPQGDEALAVALSALPDNDAVLAASLAASRVVLGEAGHPRALYASPAPPRVASIATPGPDPRTFVAALPVVARNLPVPEASAPGVGVFTLPPEQARNVTMVPAGVAVLGQLRPALRPA